MGIKDWLFGKASTEKASGPGPAPPSGPADAGGGPAGPPTCPGNPGRSAGGKVAFTNGERQWTESFDLVESLARVLRDRRHEITEHEAWIAHRPSGFILRPLLVDIEILEQGGVHTLTTVDVRHPDLLPSGLFEYQHFSADTIRESVTRGFEGWESVDLPVLLDALRPKPEHCSVFVMTFPAKGGKPSRVRRAVLGSVAYFARHPPAPADEAPEARGREDGDHPFCNCCFLTRHFEAFREQIEGDAPVGIRFYAARNEDGAPGADCRINGEDYEPGMEALRASVATWPGTGFEFRKQYVFLHTAPGGTSAEELAPDQA